MSTEPISAAAFREALAHFASGVTVVASRDAAGLFGFTATGFTSVSLAPPLILVCVGKTASVYGRIVEAVHFGVSILSERQGGIAQQFAQSKIDRFRDVTLRDASTPLIDGAVAALECRRHAHHDGGDHTILVGEVVGVFVGAGRPLVHCSRRFGAFVAEGYQQPSSSAVSVQRGGEA
ncbi:MAG: flavin reductase family protein [Polyangiaceae bacterium]|jgi:flavin reductase (DIM6/NTAB) family NADH-FMN oxidoreductase RutF